MSKNKNHDPIQSEWENIAHSIKILKRNQDEHRIAHELLTRLKPYRILHSQMKSYA